MLGLVESLFDHMNQLVLTSERREQLHHQGCDVILLSSCCLMVMELSSNRTEPLTNMNCQMCMFVSLARHAQFFSVAYWEARGPGVHGYVFVSSSHTVFSKFLQQCSKSRWPISYQIWNWWSGSLCEIPIADWSIPTSVFEEWCKNLENHCVMHTSPISLYTYMECCDE